MSDGNNEINIGILDPDTFNEIVAALPPGTVPPNVTRLIIDTGYPGSPGTVHWECHATREVLTVAVPKILRAAKLEVRPEDSTE